VQFYQEKILRRRSDVDFDFIAQKLQQIARQEGLHRTGASDAVVVVPGEGNPGVINGDEPEVVQRMRARLRMLHHPKSTEDCYVGWIRKFIRHLDDDRLERYRENDIANFLTELAVCGNVTAGTQNQALAAITWFYANVLNRDLAFVNRVRAKSSEHRPVVLSRQEIAALAPWFQGAYRVMFQLFRSRHALAGHN